MKWLFEALENIVWLTQLGLSIMLPPLLCLWGCRWLQERFALGGWVYIPGLMLGLGAGAVSFQKFASMWLKRAKKEGKDAPPSFNKH